MTIKRMIGLFSLLTFSLMANFSTAHAGGFDGGGGEGGKELSALIEKIGGGDEVVPADIRAKLVTPTTIEEEFGPKAVSH